MSEHLPPLHELDTRGLSCPEPVMMLHGTVRDAKAGDTIKVYATDPAAQRDIAKFCQFLGHELVSVESFEQEWHFTIIKG